MTQRFPRRYVRNTPALTEAENALLRSKRVCVVGCGGLGGYIIELLARLGVGRIVAVDGDCFDETNLNRQLLCEEAAMGASKALAAQERISRVNSEVTLVPLSVRMTEENAASLLDGCDLAMDALDSAADRKLLARACAAAGIPLVHGAISGFCAQIAVLTPGSPVFELLYPGDAEPANLGAPAFAPAFAASLQVCEAVKLLAGRDDTLAGRLLVCDLLHASFETVSLE